MEIVFQGLFASGPDDVFHDRNYKRNGDVTSDGNMISKIYTTLHKFKMFVFSTHSYSFVSSDAPAPVSQRAVIYMSPSTVYQYGGGIQRAYKSLRRIFRPRPRPVSCPSRARTVPSNENKINLPILFTSKGLDGALCVYSTGDGVHFKSHGVYVGNQR